MEEEKKRAKVRKDGQPITGESEMAGKEEGHKESRNLSTTIESIQQRIVRKRRGEKK